MPQFFGNLNARFHMRPPLPSPLDLSSLKYHKKGIYPQMGISITTPIPNKRPKTMASQVQTHQLDHQSNKQNHRKDQSLLPGLPNHIAQLCLSLVPHSTLSSVCHSWRRLIYSPSFSPFSSMYSILLPTQTTSTSLTDPQLHLSSSVQFASFDPISSRWLPLPPLPPDPPLNFLLRHPSFISRNLPVQSVSVSGNLILLAATAEQFLPAVSRPLIFSPLSGRWTYGPSLSTPRRWCATGASGGVVYVASGIGSQYSPGVARSVEKWDLDSNFQSVLENGKVVSSGSRWKWEKMGELRDGKFSREAIDAIGWRGKLCMVNVKGDAAKEGIIYNVKSDAWEEMPDGMLQGWKGPAAAMDEDLIFAVDESKGMLRKYDPESDDWDLILQNEKLKGARSVAVGGGRACVVCAGGKSIFVVDVVAATPPRFWVVEAPQGFEALDVHILPRMSR